VRIESFPMGVFQVNSYLLQCESTGAAAIVDPGEIPQTLLDRLDEWGVEPVAILNTHGHIDHVAGIAGIRRRFDVPFWLHADDRFFLERFDEQARAFGLDLEAPPLPDRELVPGETFLLGECELRILHTPGHSPGSVTFVHGRQAISGDVLFAGSIGRTDLPLADAKTLFRSIDDVLVPLGADVTIHSGHGPATTIGRELATNPFLAAEARRYVLES
jgi:glyoxylase-like metal-dependent hydrolase (beta-lactamase superfamily II)